MPESKPNDMDFFEKVGYVFGLVKPSWEAFKLNWSTFVLLWLLPLLMSLLLIPLVVLPLLGDSTLWNAASVTLLIIGVLATFFVVLLIWPAMLTTQFASIAGEKISLDKALNESKDVIIKFVLASILMFFIIIGPLLLTFPLLLLIVGFFLLPFAFLWALVAPFFLALVPFIIVTEKLGPIDAIKRSFELAKEHWQWVLAVYVVLLGLNLALSLVSWIPLLGTLASVAVGIAYFCMPAYVFVNHVQVKVKDPSTKSSASPKTIKKSPTKKAAKKSSK